MNDRLPNSTSAHRDWGAVRIAGIYLLIGGLWILFSDRIAAAIVGDHSALATLSILKGWGYVFVTALVLYAMIQRHTSSLYLSEDKFAAAFRLSPDAININRLTDGLFIEVNDGFTALTGYTAKDVSGKTSLEVNLWANPADRARLIAGLRERGRVENLEAAFRLKDGQIKTGLMSAKIIQVDGIPCILSITRDISERKCAEEALRESEERLRNIVETTDEIIYTLSPEGVFTFVSPAWTRWLGHPISEIEGKHYAVFIHPEDIAVCNCFLEQVISTGVSQRGIEYRVRHQNGVWKWHSSAGAVIKDAQGHPVSYVGIAQDISERKKVEDAQQESEIRFRSIFENSTVGVALVGLDGKYLMVNSALCDILGYSNEELLAHDFIRLTHPDDMELSQKTMQEVIQHKSKSIRFAKRYLHKDGHTVWTEVSSVLMPGEGTTPPYFITHVSDITERKRAEEALRESEKMYRSVIENIQDVFYRSDRQGRLVMGSPSGAKMFGYASIDEMIGVPLDSFWPDPVERQRLLTQIKTMGYVKDYEAELRRKDGTTFQAAFTTHFYHDEHGNIIGTEGIIRDVTERKRAEQALQMFRYTIDQAPDGVQWMNKEAGFEYVNERAASSVGYTREELLNLHLWDVDPVYPKELWNSNWDRYQKDKQGGGEHLESVHRRKDGTIFPVEVSSNHIWFGDRELHVAYVRDITERKRSEKLIQALNSAALAMQQVSDSTEIFSAATGELAKIGLSSVIFAADAERDHLIVKHRSFTSRIIRMAERLTGHRGGTAAFSVEPVAVFKKAVREKQPSYITNTEAIIREQLPSPFNRLAGLLVRLLQVPQAIVAPLVVEGEVIGLLTVHSPQLMESDMPKLMAFAHQLAAAWRQSTLFEQAQQEIAARKQAEQEIRRLNEDLEQRVMQRTAELHDSNQELEAFAYSVSHDLRAPLRAIDGYSRMLLEDYGTSLEPEGKRLGQIVRDEAQRMGQLIDDLLAFSRLGRAPVRVSEIDMRALVSSVFDELTTPQSRERIDWHLAALSPAWGDPKLIRQVWINLLSNALKFSARQERAIIEVGSTAGVNETTYYVRDNGAGFDMEYASKLFGVFQRLHSAREFEGTGVGLAIVQRVIHRHGGRIWGEGKVDQGAAFYFALPPKGERS